MALFGNDSSSAIGQSTAAINSSGWVVGKGNARGGKLGMSTGGTLPPAGWLSLLVVAGAYFYFKKKRGK